MKALFNLKSAINQSTFGALVAILALLPAMNPHLALANQTSKNKTALVFNIQDPSVLFKDSTDENQKLLTIEEITSNDPLTIRLKDYLEDHNSPLSAYSSEITKQPQWQRALAISWVESNFGRRCADNNCSGIGVEPGHPAWRKYKTKLDWFVDMCKLLEKPIYKEKYTTFEKMRGIYVYPGSDAWVNGSKKKYAELMALTSLAQEERTLAAYMATQNSNLTTFPQLAIAK
ncbi:MAG: hypothetical protein JNN11_00320 [Candidatus Doudnabacteria bacterium]|nr:hypothetical protein [Candidatus Doudnabacteria bacterium]